MSCPNCGCKETYQHDEDDEPTDNLERCAACGLIFPIEDHADEFEDVEQ